MKKNKNKGLESIIPLPEPMIHFNNDDQAIMWEEVNIILGGTDTYIGVKTAFLMTKFKLIRK